VKKFKLIIICLGAFILSGCNIEYTIEINGDDVIENVEIVDLVQGYRNKAEIFGTYDIFSAFFEVNQDINLSEFMNSFPERTINELENGYRINYRYTFNKANYKNSRALRTAFRNVNFNVDNNSLLIETISRTNLFEDYQYLNQVAINIKTDYIITNHNADRVNGNVYTWYFNRENYNDKRILLDGRRNENNEETPSPPSNEPEESSWLETLGIVFASFVGFILVLYIIIKIKNRNS